MQECELNNVIKEKDYKAQGKLDYITIYFTRTFNWFQRFMWKTCFGVEIKNLKE